MIQFFQTMMGKAFFEARVPQAIKAIENVSEQLKRIADQLEIQNKQSQPLEPIKIERCMYCELYACKCDFDEKGRPYLTCLDCDKSIDKDCKC